MSPLKRQVEQQQPLQRRTVKPTQKRKAKKKGLYSLQGLVGMTVVRSISSFDWTTVFRCSN